jgi:hypothetical protein
VILADATAPLVIPAWLGPGLFSAAVLIGAWAFKGKTERWDEAARRTYDHATDLQKLELRVGMLEKEKPNDRRRRT